MLGGSLPCRVHAVRVNADGEVHAVATRAGWPVKDPDLLRAEERMASRIGKEMVLRNALDVTRSHYDIILLDCPPNTGTLTSSLSFIFDCRPAGAGGRGVK